MSNYENNQRNEAPNADDFLGGNYLKKEDLDGPLMVTIKDIWSETMRGERLPKLVAGFREFEKPLILNKTNIRVLARTFGTGDTAAWRGQIELYVEENVEYSGRVVGGIRVRPLPSVNEQRGQSSRGYANGHNRGGRYDDEEAHY